MLRWRSSKVEWAMTRRDGNDEPRELLLRRLRAEYADMPGLSLTPAQAQRLCNAALEDCDWALTELTGRGVLRRTRFETYIRA